MFLLCNFFYLICTTKVSSKRLPAANFILRIFSQTHKNNKNNKKIAIINSTGNPGAINFVIHFIIK